MNEKSESNKEFNKIFPETQNSNFEGVRKDLNDNNKNLFETFYTTDFISKDHLNPISSNEFHQDIKTSDSEELNPNKKNDIIKMLDFEELPQNKKNDTTSQDDKSSTSKNNNDERKSIADFLPAWKGTSISATLRPKHVTLIPPLSAIKESSKENNTFHELMGISRKKTENIESPNEKANQNLNEKKRRSKYNMKNQPWDENGKKENTRTETFDEINQSTFEEGTNSNTIATFVHSLVSNVKSIKIPKEVESCEIRKTHRKWKDYFFVKNIESWIGKYDVIYNDFKQNTKISHFLVIFDMTRYLFIAMIVAFFQNYYLFVIGSLLALNTSFCLYLFIYFPFKENFKNMLTILTELANLLATFGALIIAICDYTENYDINLRLNAGWMIVYSNIVMICILLLTFLTMIIQLICKFWSEFRNYKKSNCQVLDLIKENSGENFDKNKFWNKERPLRILTQKNSINIPSPLIFSPKLS